MIQYDEYLLKKRAAGSVSSALKKGLLVKTPCMACGALNVEAHHVDYSRPLSVIWLCKPHHELAHHPDRKRGNERQGNRRFEGATQDAFL